MPAQLTETERKVYHYLLDFLAEQTYQPSIREIGRTFEIKSTKTVSEILGSLAAKGYIERDAARSRGVRLLGFEVSRQTQPVPYYGKIAAGEPALLPENRQRYITMDRSFLPREDVFFLKVAGDSMIGRGIHDGDFILILPETHAEDGAIVAARLGADATVKTITYRDGRTVLVPANPADREIVVAPGDDFALLGTVCGVFRPFEMMMQQ
ncbi:MAG TPA: transcriptional repressor LexA [Gemmatimonadaceae bacterium]|nr:transcriptional repressor LexA [Gemmatimonadaceae bacterium]